MDTHMLKLWPECKTAIKEIAPDILSTFLMLTFQEDVPLEKMITAVMLDMHVSEQASKLYISMMQSMSLLPNQKANEAVPNYQDIGKMHQKLQYYTVTNELYYQTVTRLGKRLNREPVIKKPIGYVLSREPDAHDAERADLYVIAAEYYIRILNKIKKAQAPAVKVKNRIRGRLKRAGEKLQNVAGITSEENQRIETDMRVLESLYSILQWYIDYLNNLEFTEE